MEILKVRSVRHDRIGNFEEAARAFAGRDDGVDPPQHPAGQRLVPTLTGGIEDQPA